MNNQTAAQIINKLQVPAVISDILSGTKQEEEQFALSAIISDMQPDTALLAMACSMKRIVAPYLQASPSLQITDMECEKLIKDYIDHITGQPLTANMDQENAVERLDELQEDYEYLLQLIDLDINFLSAKDAIATQLCVFIKKHLSAQKLIVETMLQALDEDFAKVEDKPIFASNKNNVIPFRRI